ncbi:hypothetical protein [Mycobacterium talmoniae]|uniref:Uncharacterized protein n=1 Tax=Mycobacterium talmoniae TaxID=1858794 RepID=A0A1S1NIM6_9MYCO|nr:hypothetical protein [Mycobacterium talmoniae]OHV03698.1 hypothetical protein BKN37_13575 [Mycobacterium talmoniae]
MTSILETGSGSDLSRAALKVLAGELRALHKVIEAPGGITLCDHCCLNGVRERRFSCSGHHDHHNGAPCPTLRIVERLGL